MKKRHLTLMLGACILSLGACAQKTDLEKTLETVSQQTIKDHIYYLASDEMRGRDTGSEEILKAGRLSGQTVRNLWCKAGSRSRWLLSAGAAAYENACYFGFFGV